MAGRLTDHHGGTTGRYAPGARTDVGSEFTVWANATVSLGVVIGICIVLMPGMLLGAVLAWGVWKLTHPSWPTIAILSLGWTSGLIVESHLIPWMWPIGLLTPGRLYDLLPAVSALPYGTAVWHGLAVELGLEVEVALPLLGRREVADPLCQLLDEFRVVVLGGHY